MRAAVSFWCRLGFHKLERRIHPRNWRTCRKCGHTIFDRPTV